MVRRRPRVITKVPERSRASVAFLFLLTGFAREGIALDPSQPFRSYLSTHFTQDDNAVPSDVIHDIVQSRDGSLWLAAGSGALARFDGQHFTTFTFPRARNLALGPDGDLWVGANDGLERIPSAALNQFGRLPTVSYHPGPGPGSNIFCIHFSRSGVLWVGTAGGLYRYERGAFSAVIPRLAIHRIEEDPNGHAGPEGRSANPIQRSPLLCSVERSTNFYFIIFLTE